MKKKLHLFLLIVLCLLSLSVNAQESASRQIYNEAESEYGIGHFEQAIQLLKENIDHFEGSLKQSAYRLLALCYLGEDKDEEAQYYAEQLVKLNNYYNSTEDPARFMDIVNRLKEGMVATITTASSQSETLNEAPVPITIITAEMIEELGYNKNLGQILAAYVPGMAEVTAIDEQLNMSMHGAYSQSQELILIMENGHRLNTRFDNTGPTSYSVSTEKIDHIEVLRGPASSLYGNVALSAVVNVITKSGRDVDGVKAKYGYGTYNTHKADFTMGTQFMDADIFVWASIYKSDGQIRHFGDGKGYLKDSRSYIEEVGANKWYYFNPDKIYVDAYKDMPAYDVGFTFRLKGFDLMFSKKNVKKVLKHTRLYGGYDYDRYGPISDVKPGNGNESTHAEIAYTRQFKKIHLEASFYSDWYKLTDYVVDYDSVINVSPLLNESYDEYLLDEDGNVKYEEKIQKGMFSVSHRKEHTMGGYARAAADYQIGNSKGNILAGWQYEKFSLRPSVVYWGSSFHEIGSGFMEDDDFIDYGQEKILSFYVQEKHYFLPQLIMNVGGRYDFKYRQGEDAVKSFSPRLALMYVPSERFSLKLSYSEAYADLSFYYRFITKTGYETLKPQHLSAIQLTAMGKVAPQHLNYEVNLFYNRYSNLLCWQEREGHSYKNTGKLINIGMEGNVGYAYNRFNAILSLYYSRDISSEHYYYNQSKEMVAGVPHFTLNLHGAWKLLQGKTHELKVYGHTSYIGRKLNYNEVEEEDFFVDSKMLFDLGVKYGYKHLFQISLDCENIFNTDHYICGPNYQHAPHFQRGRSLMASFSCQF